MFSCCFHVLLFIAFINDLLIPKEQYNMHMILAREIRENQNLTVQKGTARSSYFRRILTNSCNTCISRYELCFGTHMSFQEHKYHGTWNILLRIGSTGWGSCCSWSAVLCLGLRAPCQQ